MVMPDDAVVLDLTRGPAPPELVWTIGRYLEDRAIYTQPLFGGRRTVHVGVDLGGPVGTPVHAFADGVVVQSGYNPAAGDYGHVVITEHTLDGVSVFALVGHLSAASVAASPVGRAVKAGDVLGWLGDFHENGGWPPHVHVQLGWERPETHDMPGAVQPADRDHARRRWPDPRVVLGRLYG
jgi:murein DD-endopeptidase MepM/ murein hydrolase activator NlpD